MAELINAERAKVGRDPLQIEQNLNKSAELHSAWMLNADVFSHTGKGGSSNGERVKDAGFDMSGSWQIGENIALYSINNNGSLRDEVEAIMDGLMNSPGHKANILRDSFDYIGIGIEVGFYTQGGQTYEVLMATQNFGATSGSVILDGATGTANADKLTTTTTVDAISGGAGNDKLFGSAGSDLVKSGAGSDLVMSRAGDDVVKSGTGGDRIFGQAGQDRLYGQAGNDRLDGGTGRDVMNGGAGRDTFVFRNGNNKDKIADFNKSQDRILLDDDLWAGTLGKAKMVDIYAKVTSNGVLFDFAGNDDLLLKGLDSADGLESLITLI